MFPFFVPAQSVVSSAKLSYLGGVFMQTKEDVPQNDQLPIRESESSNFNGNEEISTEIQRGLTEVTSIFKSSSRPICLRRVDPETGKRVDVTLSNTYPLYPVVKLFDYCGEFPDFIKLTLSKDLIDEAYIASKNAIDADKTSFMFKSSLDAEPVHQSLFFITRVFAKAFCTKEYELVLLSSPPENWQNIKDNQIVLFLDQDGIAFAVKEQHAYHYFRELLPEYSKILKAQLSELKENSQQLISREDLLREPIIKIVTARIDEIRKKNELLLSLAHMNLDIIKLCRKKVIQQQKRQKSVSLTEFETLVSAATRSLIEAHFLAGNYEICESYCRDLLDFLAKIKLKDVQDIAMRRFVAKYYLSMVYINFGYLEIAEQTAQELADILNKPFYAGEYDDLVENFGNLCEGLMIAYQQKGDHLGILKTMGIARSFFDNPTKNKKQASKDHFPFSEKSATIFNRYQNLQRFYEPAKTKYKEELQAEMKGFSGIEKFVPGFNAGTLKIVLKEDNLLPHLSTALASLNLSVQKDSSENSLTVDIYQCTPKLLKQAWESSLTLAEKTKEEALRAKEARERIENQPAISLSSPSTQVFSSPISQPQPKPGNKKRRGKEKNHPSTHKSSEVKNQAKKAPEKKAPEVIKEYHWPNTQVAYYSTNKQKGEVKSLHHDAIPEGVDVWFGYIPDWIKKVPGYDPTALKLFNAKLETGLLSHDCVRDVKKELNNLNPKYYKDFRYKFKIVLGAKDPRLYGWIDDIIVDADGRKRYLVCFGYIGLHGEEALPNPEVWKKKMANHIDNVGPQPQQQATNATTTTINATNTTTTDSNSSANINFRPGGYIDNVGPQPQQQAINATTTTINATNTTTTDSNSSANINFRPGGY